MEEGRAVSALLIVDVQNDFCQGGALAVPHADDVIPVIQNIRRHCGHTLFHGRVFATQDWHPPDHVSFVTSHPGHTVFEVITLPDGRQQILWPPHGIAGADGAKIVQGIDIRDVAVVRKGTDPRFDSYSGFRDNSHFSETKLEMLLNEQKVARLYVCGLATDYCVRHTCLDAVKQGFQTFLIEDACRGVNEQTVKEAIQEMMAAGVKMISSAAVIHEAESGLY